MVDGGATKTLGSVAAVQAMLDTIISTSMEPRASSRWMWASGQLSVLATARRMLRLNCGGWNYCRQANGPAQDSHRGSRLWPCTAVGGVASGFQGHRGLRTGPDRLTGFRRQGQHLLPSEPERPRKDQSLASGTRETGNQSPENSCALADRVDERRGSDFSSCGDREPERVEFCGASSCQSPNQVRLPAGPQRHAEHEQGASQVAAPGPGRRNTERVDHGGDSTADRRDPAADGGGRKNQGDHGDASLGQAAEPSPPTQVRHGEVRAGRPGSAPVRERDHPKDGEDGDGSHPGHFNGPRGGHRGVRETCVADLQGVEGNMPNLCSMGGPHQRGKQGNRSPPSSLGEMVGQNTIRGPDESQDGGRPQV